METFNVSKLNNVFQHTAARRRLPCTEHLLFVHFGRFNTQPRGGGCF